MHGQQNIKYNVKLSAFP